MKHIRLFAIFLLNIFVGTCLYTRFIGCQTMQFANNKIQNKYSSYAKVAKQEMKSNVHAVILIPQKELQIIKVFKTPIGQKIDGQHIDSTGQLYTPEDNTQTLITVNGNHKKWAEYYQRLKGTSVLKEIYYVTIYEHTIDIWVNPGVLVQLDNQIENLEEFYNQFPYLFTKGKIIDLRCTKRVGISNIKA